MLLSEATKTTGVAVYEWLDHEATIPTVDNVAAQGDVTITSTRHLRLKAATTPLPAGGVVVMQAERGGHTHTLHGAGCLYDTVEEDLHIGTLTVPAGCEALLMHEEHGGLLIAPGSYRIGGQREYAGEWRRVAD